MSQGIGSFLVLIVAVHQIFCQDDFQNIVLTKLEKIENENVKLVQKVELYKKISQESATKLESVENDYREFKQKSLEEIEKCNGKIENLATLSHDINGLQSLTSAKSCWQIAMQGIDRSGKYNVDPDGIYSGGEPFWVQCSFPDNSTIIGKDVEIQVGKCNEFQCFEAKMDYEMPIAQMKKLFALSGSCMQKVDFKCKLAPLKSRDGDDLFSWTDAQGIQHSLPGTNCNQNDPIWKMDSIEVTDMALLPIQKISYGPLVYEPEEAKVAVSAITCTAPEKERWDEYTLEGQIINLETKLTEEWNEVKTEIDQNYQLLNSTITDLKEKVTGEYQMPDQCRVHQQLTSSKRRFDAPNNPSNNICDQFGKSITQEDWQGEGFYRVEGSAGTKLSENCNSYQYGNCGTHIGGHLMGGHPELIGQTVVRTVKFQGCDYNGNDNFDIKVTNCGSFYVYYLKEVGRCSLGYCTE